MPIYFQQRQLSCLPPWWSPLRLVVGVLLSVSLLSVSTAAAANQSHTLLSKSSGNGSISPVSMAVEHDEAASFTITPDSGYVIDQIKTGGRCGGSLSGNTFTIAAVTRSCYLRASRG